MDTVPLGAGGAIPRPLLFPAGTKRRGLVTLVAAVAVMALTALARADSTSSTGSASFYSDEFADRPTASGQRYDPVKLTGAHRTLPLGSRVRVTNLLNGRSVLVTINDRGPYTHRRDIDLSFA